jgi:hypothetical protein
VTRRLVAWSAAALVAGGLTGCGVQTLSYPTPPVTAHAVVTAGPTLPTNLPAVAEGAVPGVTTSTLPHIGPGAATLNGTVIGPEGPVAGATVEADRLVGDQAAATQTTTAADGSWSIRSILGGRYRIRAWQQPSLAVTSPQILFLGDHDTQTTTLQVAAFTGPTVAAAFAPYSPVVGQIDNLVVQVTNPTVGSDGVVRNPPQVGVSVTLTDGPQWQVHNGNPLATDADGQVLFQVSCQAAGPDPLSAAVGSGIAVPLQLPDCEPPPTTTTTLPPSTTTTSTTCPPASTLPGTGTTTTTLSTGTC